MDLSNKSVTELRELAKQANSLADDLMDKQPSNHLALNHGVRDISYSTPRFGRISSYEGEANIIMGDGTKWKAIGHKPTGDQYTVTKRGYIEFIPVKN